MTVTCFLLLFLLGMGQEEGLTASMHGSGCILSPKKKGCMSVFQFVFMQKKIAVSYFQFEYIFLD
ncbi:hypothetical protein COL87_27355 [Bacillus pseudomycoides]|nr:hypothetical protein BLX05_09630 [Bacillus pseudomycoides]PDY09216.1 hypothetical protein COO16_26655 [Bacillus pseudomycoides]PEF75384.1 hypothetical protein CON94_10245 [Bacillus pseudomycoides]PEI45737.1 hypothetical protein CN641_14385 [Bacillus pseudomycoides]PEJ37836.1 hypothetical protein CN677_08915 [Bacillus pseudomycoides]